MLFRKEWKVLTPAERTAMLAGLCVCLYGCMRRMYGPVGVPCACLPSSELLPADALLTGARALVVLVQAAVLVPTNMTLRWRRLI